MESSRPHDFSWKVGHFIHHHRKSLTGPLGWFGLFQVGRSYISIIPHMAMFITTYHLFNRANEGLTQAIESRFGAGALLDAEKTIEIAQKAPLLRTAHMLVNSPLKPILMIGTGFTAYRATSKMFKKMWNEVFDSTHNEDDTIDYVRNFGSHLKEAAVDVIPAESQSGFYAAFALGGIRSNYKGPSSSNPGHAFSTNPHEPGFLKGSSLLQRWSPSRLHDVFVHPNGKFLQDAAITIAAYWMYFEFADRLYKDIQINRGRWKGEPNGLSPYPAVAPAGQDNPLAEPQPPSSTQTPASPWTVDPSLGRLFMKRVVPVTLGIGAYCVTNRLGHMMVGRFKPPAESLGLPFASKDFWHNFGVVGTSMGTFWAYNSVNDWWDAHYDEWFGKAPLPKPPLHSASARPSHIVAAVQAEHQLLEAPEKLLVIAR